MHDGMTRKIVLEHRFNCVIKVICSFEGNCTINLSYKRARSNGQMIRHSLDDVCRVCRQYFVPQHFAQIWVEICYFIIQTQKPYTEESPGKPPLALNFPSSNTQTLLRQYFLAYYERIML